MGFVVSKILWMIAEPSTAIAVLGLVGLGLLCFKRRAAGGTLLVLAIVALTAIRILPIDSWLLAPLESRFPILRDLPPHVDGIIALGGAVDPEMTARTGFPALNLDAERVTEFAALARRYPMAKLVFSGGSGRISEGGPAEADSARMLFGELGLDLSHIAFEDRSRTTWENAVFSKALIGPKPGEIWLLVTSARHMPRSVGVFRAVGWPVEPYPVAFKAESDMAFGLGYRLLLIDAAAHEWIGLIAYHLAGRTESWFPSPDG
jgi:uncharacterized SAM-binding protein YcdF (DUF218 family)